jgi:chemotaxis protein histidine kinase CheA
MYIDKGFSTISDVSLEGRLVALAGQSRKNGAHPLTALFQCIKGGQNTSNQEEFFLNYDELSDFMTTLGAIFENENENEKNPTKNEKLINQFFSFDNPFDNPENENEKISENDTNKEKNDENFENENENENEKNKKNEIMESHTPAVTPVGGDNDKLADLNSSLIDFSDDIENKNDVQEVKYSYMKYIYEYEYICV